MPVATAAIKDIPVLYIPVTAPVFLGILAFTKGISKTLQITIPMPVSAVPTKRARGPAETLISEPMPKTRSPRKMALALPK